MTEGTEGQDYFIRDGMVIAYDFNSLMAGIAEAYRQGYEIKNPFGAQKAGNHHTVFIKECEKDDSPLPSPAPLDESVSDNTTVSLAQTPEPGDEFLAQEPEGQEQKEGGEVEEQQSEEQTEEQEKESNWTPEDVEHLTREFIEEAKREGLDALKELGKPFGITDRSKSKLAKELHNFAERVRGNIT